MEFKFNVQQELQCNREGFAVIRANLLYLQEYENSEHIKEVVSAMRQAFKKAKGFNSLMKS